MDQSVLEQLHDHFIQGKLMKGEKKKKEKGHYPVLVP